MKQSDVVRHSLRQKLIPSTRRESVKKFLAVLSVACFLVLPARAQTKGNGLPAGQKLLYNLEVIAYNPNNCPSGDFTGSNTHRIAVKADVGDLGTTKGATALTLVRQNDILLAEGPTFQVLSGNACATGTATFQLPANPCNDPALNLPCSVDDPTFQNYGVYARLVGKPNTGVNVTTCATDPLTGLIVCSTESWISVRASGKNSAPKFTNVSKQLLSVCVDTTVPPDGTCDTRIALFDAQLNDYFWNWDTTGKAHAQLFFVALPD
jgi:hypothetical protein